MTKQKVTIKFSHATILHIVTDLVHLWFQACLKVDRYFLILKI